MSIEIHTMQKCNTTYIYVCVCVVHLFLAAEEVVLEDPLCVGSTF